MEKILAVITDLDGTIVDENGSVSDATLFAAAELSFNQIPLIVATDRSPAWISKMVELSTWIKIAVCCGGGIGWVPQSDEILWRYEISGDVMARFFQAIRSSSSKIGVAMFDGFAWKVPIEYLENAPKLVGEVKVVGSEEIICAGVYTILVCKPSSENWSFLPTSLVEEPSIKLDRLSEDVIGIAPASDFDKGEGVARVLRQLSVDAPHAIAFGDMLNDIPVFEFCGVSVAVANAHPTVTKASSKVTNCVHNDGFARMLCSLGLVSNLVLKNTRIQACGCPTGPFQ